LVKPIYYLFVAEPLSIGWGKKETQFHGKIGKEARTIIEVIIATK